MAPHIPQMKENIAKALHMEPDCLNIKATTEEKLGFTGREEGIASQAVCLYTRNNVVVRTSTKCCRSLELVAAK